jgi:hypothetical protein
MKIVEVAGFPPIMKNPPESAKLYRDGLGLPLKKQEDYLSVDHFPGVKHFASRLRYEGDLPKSRNGLRSAERVAVEIATEISSGTSPARFRNNAHDAAETQEMKIDIDRLSEAELIDLNNRIVERLKFLHSARAHAEMLEFRIGERVSFEPPGRGRLIGTLVKYNRKTVTVVTPDGQTWNVSPHFLSPVGAQKAPRTREGNVIELKPK